MYYVKKTMEVSASHSLSLNYESKCSTPHGHNWRITVYCKSRQLDVNGMVVDFTLNEVLPFNPTAENIARWCCEQVEQCYRVEVQESLGNVAVYEDDDFDETH